MIMTTEVRSPFCLNEASFTHAREGGDLQIVAIGLLSFDEKHRQMLEDQNKDDDRVPLRALSSSVTVLLMKQLSL